jgi:hypothetical protein
MLLVGSVKSTMVVLHQQRSMYPEAHCCLQLSQSFKLFERLEFLSDSALKYLDRSKVLIDSDLHQSLRFRCG